MLAWNIPEKLPFDIKGCPLPIGVMCNDEPKGFGANHNQALRQLSAEYFGVVNPDIRLTDDPFDKLLANPSETGDSLAVPVVVNPQGVGLKDSAWKFQLHGRFRRRLLGRWPD